ncbi:hypothetical protein [Vibrio sp. DNB22_19_2]
MLILNKDRLTARLFLFIFVISSFGSGFFSTYLGVSTGKFYVLCIAIALVYFIRNDTFRGNTKTVILSVGTCLLVLMLVSVNIAGESNIAYFQSVYFYMIVFMALFVSDKWNDFYKIAIIVLYLNFPLLIYEIYTGSYIVQSSSDFGPEYGRVKGIFEYSKMLGYFCIILGLLCYKRMSTFTLVLVLFSSLLSGSRLAIIPILIVFFVKVILSILIDSSIKVKVISLMSILVSFGLLSLYLSHNSGSEIIVSRLSNAFSTTSSSNSERIYYWTQHLSVFDERGLWSIIFGEPGDAYMKIGNGSESSYIHLLLEGGVSGFLLYSLAFLVLIYCLFLKEHIIHKWTGFLGVFLLILCFQISRIGLSVIDGTYFWVFVLYCLFYGKVDDAKN